MEFFLGFYNHLLPEEFQRTTRLSIPQVAKKLPSLEKQTLVISNWWGLLISSEFEPDGIVNKSLLTSAFHDLDAGGKVSSWLFFKLKCWENFSFHKKSSLATKYQFWHTGETLQISLICKYEKIFQRLYSSRADQLAIFWQNADYHIGFVLERKQNVRHRWILA